MRAERFVPLVWAGLLINLALIFGQLGDPAIAAHSGHLLNGYFVHQFIENPPVGVPIYDCSGQGHTHGDIISLAVTNWNNTGRANFSYTSGATTPCVVGGGLDGFPVNNDRISVYHNDSVPTANYSWITYPDEAFRANDVGTEGDVGMFRLQRGIVRISSGYHLPYIMQHELGHAAGLADLYNDDGSNPCTGCHSHIPDTTVMDGSHDFPSTPGQHDLDNLDALYKRTPEQVTNFTIFSSTLDHNASAAMTFTWSDKSFNEQYQYIAMDNDENGIGEGYPLVANRDQEYIAWTGLQPETRYCFFIQPKNAYGIYGSKSSTVCATTPTPVLPPPVNLTTTFITTSTIRLTWSSVRGALHYHVCQDTSPTGSFTNCPYTVNAPTTTRDVPAPSLADGLPYYWRLRACDQLDQCSYLGSDWITAQRANVSGWNYAFTFYRAIDGIKFQFINQMPFNLALKLHLKNGTLSSSPNVAETSCVLYNQISPVETFSPTLFTALVVGTVGHDVSGGVPTCGSSHTNDGTSVRWAYLQPPPPPPSMTSTFTSTTVNQITWPAVTGAANYLLCSMFDNNGSKGGCTGNPPGITGTSTTVAVPTEHLLQWYTKVKACNALLACGDLSRPWALAERVNSSGWNYSFTFYRDGSDIKFQFINSMPFSLALQLHLRNGINTTSTLITDTACIPANTVSSLTSFAASLVTTLTLGTQGHDVLDTVNCDTSHTNDATFVGWGVTPP